MNGKKSTTEEVERLAVGVEEAADMLGIGRSSVFALMNAGALKSLKVGKRRLIAVAELRAFLDRQTKQLG